MCPDTLNIVSLISVFSSNLILHNKLPLSLLFLCRHDQFCMLYCITINTKVDPFRSLLYLKINRFLFISQNAVSYSFDALAQARWATSHKLQPSTAKEARHPLINVGIP